MQNRPSIAIERRKHHALREIFPEACTLLAPVIEGANKTLGVSSFSMMHILQTRYPELSATEAHVLVAAVERLSREGKLHNSQ